MKTIGIHSPGDMGHAVGRVLKMHGFDVIVCVADRSERTQALSKHAGLREVATLHQFIDEADLLLSILVPSRAEQAAVEIANAMKSHSVTTHVVDCNAVSPATVERIATIAREAGASFSDASIVGFPPGTAAPPRFYVSGPLGSELMALDNEGIQVKVIGAEIGQASGLKMCYAGLTKGSFALYYALMIVAERLGMVDDLLAEFDHSQQPVLERMQKFLPRLPAKAWRWEGEMHQIAETLASEGMPAEFHRGAAEVYHAISQTSLGQETPETIDENRTLEQTLKILANECKL